VRTFALPFLMLSLATVAHAADTCAEGDGWACLQDARAAQKRGEETAALAGFSAACRADLLDGCLEEGRWLLARGDLDHAEPPLRRVQASDRADAYEALADLYQSRGDPAVAEQLRWDGLAIEQPAAEFVGSYRYGQTGLNRTWDESFVIDLRIHPMAFDARRRVIGLEGVLGHGYGAMYGTMGLQHFVTDWLILYGDALVGLRTEGYPLDGGLRAGVELAVGFVGHLDVGVTSTAQSPFSVSVGVGLDWLIALEAAAEAL
jgi:hypothetical protein